IGLTLRWVALFGLLGIAAGAGFRARRSVPRSLVVPLSALSGIAVLSAAWSVAPRTSAERAVTIVVLTAVVSFVAAASASSAAVRRAAGASAGLLLAGSILASGSRGAIFGVASGCVVFLLVRLRPLRVLAPVVAVVVAGAVIAVVVAGRRPSSAVPTPPSDLVATRKPGASGGVFTVPLTPAMKPNLVPVPFVSEYDEIG